MSSLLLTKLYICTSLQIFLAFSPKYRPLSILSTRTAGHPPPYLPKMDPPPRRANHKMKFDVSFKAKTNPRDQPHGSFYTTTYTESRLETIRNANRPLPNNPEGHFSPSGSPNVPPNPTRMAADKDALDRADNNIDDMIENLPLYPLLLTPHSDIPILQTNKVLWETQGLPFDKYELGRGLQYMTMYGLPANRGATFIESGWQTEGISPPSINGVRSGTATPDPNKPRIKMSLADYKKVPKKTDEEIERARALQAMRRKEEEAQKKKEEEQMAKKVDEHHRKRDAELQAIVQSNADASYRRKEQEAKREKERRQRRQVLQNILPPPPPHISPSFHI